MLFFWVVMGLLYVITFYTKERKVKKTKLPILAHVVLVIIMMVGAPFLMVHDIWRDIK